ncbi:MAG: hypothetical protein AAF211_29470, partial [Myxococcota bacterium]
MKPLTVVLSIEDSPDAVVPRLDPTLVERVLLLVPPGQGGTRQFGENLQGRNRNIGHGPAL